MNKQNRCFNFIYNMKMNRWQAFCLFDMIWISKIVASISYYIWEWIDRKHFAYSLYMNKQNRCFNFILYIKLTSMAIILLIRYIWISKMLALTLLVIWNKLIVCESDKRFFVQIRLAYQWSCFSRMILWWSNCSASMTVC